MQCSVPDKLHVFLINYENYQYNSACHGLWNVLPLSRNWISPQYLSFDWCSYHALCTRVYMLNVKSVWHIHTCKHNNHVPFLSFQMCSKYFFALNIIRTRSFFIFIHFLIARSFYFYAFQFLIFNCFVDVSNLFVDVSNFFFGAWSNSFGK